MMKTKWALRLLASLLLTAAGILWLSPYHRQLLFGPRIQGIPICAWQEHVRRQLRPSLANDSFLDRIREWFLAKSTIGEEWRKLGDLDKAQVYLSMIDDPDNTLRKEIAISLQNLNPDHAEAVVVRLLDDPDDSVRDATAGSNRFTPAASAKLEELLNHVDASKRAFAVKHLTLSHGRDKRSLDLLAGMLNDADATVRATVAEAMAQWRGRRMAGEYAQHVLAQLKDADAKCRIEAAYAAWCMGRNVTDAVPVLSNELKNPDETMRLAAARHLQSMRKDALPAFDDLVHAALHDPSRTVRAASVLSLGHGGKKAIPLLLKCLQSDDHDICKNAIRALGDVGPEAADTAPAIFAHFESCDLQVLVALQKLKAAALVPQLCALLDDANCNRSWVLQTLGSMGPGARAAVPRLLELLEEESGVLRKEAAVALAQIEEIIDRAIKILLEIIDDKEGTMTGPLLTACEQIGTKLKPALSELLPRLRDAEHPNRWIVIVMLGAIGPDAEAAIPDLLAVLELSGKKNNILVLAAAQALGSIKRQPAKVVPALSRHLGTEFWLLRPTVIEALGKFGPEALDSVSSLARYVDDDDLALSDRALAALSKIDPQRFPAPKSP